MMPAPVPSLPTPAALARAPRFAPSALAIAVTIALMSVAALVHVYVHLQLIEMGYELSRESRLGHDLGEQNQKLRLELAVRNDPATVERRAREELHMEPPDPRLIRVLRAPAVDVAKEKR